MSADNDVDAYIASAAEASQPILRRIRRLVQAAFPDAAECIQNSCRS